MIRLDLDYHAHILPGCDHGCDCLDTSLKQIAMAKSAGIVTVCATPHFYPQRETTGSFLERRWAAYMQLVTALPPWSPEILLGAEVLICDGLDRLPDLDKLCLQGTNEILLEMPFYKWSEHLWDTLYALCEKKDVKIVAAHVDRYPKEDVLRLMREDVTLQINAEGLSKHKNRKTYLSWIELGSIRYLGSDIHMLDKGYGDYEKCRRLIQKHSKV
jgi:protein-tyrosine phosphatase